MAIVVLLISLVSGEAVRLRTIKSFITSNLYSR